METGSVSDGFPAISNRWPFPQFLSAMVCKHFFNFIPPSLKYSEHATVHILISFKLCVCVILTYNVRYKINKSIHLKGWANIDICRGLLVSAPTCKKLGSHPSHPYHKKKPNT